jgi:hypothetical protein
MRTLLQGPRLAAAEGSAAAGNIGDLDLNSALPDRTERSGYGVTRRGDMDEKTCNTILCNERIRSNAVCRRCIQHCPDTGTCKTKHKPLSLLEDFTVAPSQGPAKVPRVGE